MLVVVGLLLEVGNMENIRKSRETIGRIVCWETLLAMKLVLIDSLNLTILGRLNFQYPLDGRIEVPCAINSSKT